MVGCSKGYIYITGKKQGRCVNQEEVRGGVLKSITFDGMEMVETTPEGWMWSNKGAVDIITLSRPRRNKRVE